MHNSGILSHKKVCVNKLTILFHYIEKTKLRPEFLARYSAKSASSYISEILLYWSALGIHPMLTVQLIGFSSPKKGVYWIFSFILLAIRLASSLSIRGKRITNSSPPIRAI